MGGSEPSRWRAQHELRAQGRGNTRSMRRAAAGLAWLRWQLSGEGETGVRAGNVFSFWLRTLEFRGWTIGAIEGLVKFCFFLSRS